MIMKKLTLILEDCEEFTFDGGYVGAFSVEKISKHVGRVLSNSYRSFETADSVEIEIHSNANGTDGEIFDRIVRASNIVSLDFELVDDIKSEEVAEHHFYMVNWTSEDGCSNLNQKAKVSANGHLYILIDKDEALEEVFPAETVDDVRYDYGFNGSPLLAIREPDTFRVLHFENHRRNCEIRLGNSKVTVYGLRDVISPSEVAGMLLDAMLELLEEKHAALEFEHHTFEFHNRGDLLNVQMIHSKPARVRIESGEGDKLIEKEEPFDCMEFVLELAAELKENIDFWADSECKESDEKECATPEEKEQLLSRISLLLQKIAE